MRRDCSKDCSACEMLIPDENIVIVEQQGLSENRRILRAVKCGRFGQYATSIAELPKSDLLDDIIWK